MTTPRVFLDMDGVLCDFMTQLHRYLGLSYGIHGECYPYPKDTFLGVYDYMGMSRSQIFNPQRFEEFWAQMPWMPGGKETLAAVLDTVPIEQVALLSHPPKYSPQAYAGKMHWVMKNAPELSESVIPTGLPKGDWFVVEPNRVLIDDWVKNTDSFTKAGGSAILVPRPWNRLHADFHEEFDAYAYVRNNLSEWMNTL